MIDDDTYDDDDDDNNDDDDDDDTNGHDTKSFAFSNIHTHTHTHACDLLSRVFDVDATSTTSFSTPSFPKFNSKFGTPLCHCCSHLLLMPTAIV